jgi:hypothetical protein
LTSMLRIRLKHLWATIKCKKGIRCGLSDFEIVSPLRWNRSCCSRFPRPVTAMRRKIASCSSLETCFVGASPHLRRRTCINFKKTWRLMPNARRKRSRCPRIVLSISRVSAMYLNCRHHLLAAHKSNADQSAKRYAWAPSRH